MTYLKIELAEGDPMRVLRRGTLYTRFGMSTQKVDFIGKQLEITDTIDLERVPQVLLTGPRLKADGSLSIAQNGEVRLDWSELAHEYREAFRQRQRQRLIDRIASLKEDLALIEAKMLEEAPQ